MAETEHHDRTEQPTQKRLDDARREGRIPRSRDLTAAAVMITAGIALKASGDAMGTQLGRMMKTGLSIPRDRLMDERLLAGAFGDL
ncbi:MAG TPA: EscU/YscU/HrcU family type III secretion system export apparatus switch protein, partial [Steroidobacteraceae bacterium]|nr:EscU/YscU/HrcU family type III secretion system export apparatus switch protein [Steroidobacteraceae bacterium]